MSISQLYIEKAGHHINYDHNEEHLEHAIRSLEHLNREKMQDLKDKANNGEHAEFHHNGHSFVLRHGDDGYYAKRYHHAA